MPKPSPKKAQEIRENLQLMGIDLSNINHRRLKALLQQIIDIEGEIFHGYTENYTEIYTEAYNQSYDDQGYTETYTEAYQDQGYNETYTDTGIIRTHKIRARRK